MDTSSAYCRSRAASTEPPPVPYFRLDEPVPLTRFQDSLKKCLPAALRIAFDGSGCFSVIDVRPPRVLGVTAPDPAINGGAWAELAITVLFEVPVSLLEGLEGDGQ